MQRDRPDILGDWLAVALFYGLPVAAIVVSGGFILTPGVRAAIWALALLTMSGGCLINALRCHRVHCYFTAPFFFAMAIASAMYGVFGAPFGASGWNAISSITLVGGLALYYVPERLLGRYRNI